MSSFCQRTEGSGIRAVRRACAVLLLTLLLMVMYGPTAVAQSREAGRLRLEDVTASSHISFRHTDGSCGHRYIIENMTAGLALFDYDGDGYVDIYFLNGAPTRGARAEVPPRNALYRNLGDWRFVDVTEQAGVGDTGFGLGVAAGDYDNDGYQDLYVSNFGANVLYRNQGDGTFLDVTAETDVEAGDCMGAGVCFLDMEGDGDLDLFCANYVNFTYENHVAPMVRGFPQYAGPKDYEPVADVLFRNNGDGTFTDVSVESGIAAQQGTGMGTVCLDYDNDGDTDIVVMNDVRGNYLYENNGSGQFTEVGTQVGIGYNANGMELGSMGVECADYDNDGWLDLFQTSYSGELPALYRNTGVGFFEDVTRVAGAGTKTFPHVNWGAAFVDFDCDTRRDLFIANGHLQDNIEQYDESTAFEVPNTLLWNAGSGEFLDVSDSGGSGMLVRKSSRGAGADDMDNDGHPDIVVLNSRSAPTILRNTTPTTNHWIKMRLRGTSCNRDAVGSHVRVRTGDVVQLAEVHSGRGYQSHYGTLLHFGLGAARTIDRIEVRWLGGGTSVLQDVAVDQRLDLVQGSEATSQEPSH